VDKAVQQLIKRIQILIPLFIEGGTFIGLDDPEWSLERWTVFFLYEKGTGITPGIAPYTFMGYCTVYRYFYFQPKSGDLKAKKQIDAQDAPISSLLEVPNITFSSVPARSRLSQFIIIPPFQHGGNGSRFYNAIVDFYLAEKSTIEITVEDPNELFDDMRDINDLARLRLMPEFAAIRINNAATPKPKGNVPVDILDRNLLKQIRVKSKTAPRQFARVLEMQLLSLIPQEIRQPLSYKASSSANLKLKQKEHEYYLWGLWTKMRLYRHNKEQLAQLDRVERIERLDGVLGNVEADYLRLLSALEEREKNASGKGVSSANGTRAASGSKRGPPDDEENEPSSKKVRVSENEA
jgi:histone acetyltransferase 1